MGEMAEWSMTDHPDDNDYPEKEPMTDKRLEEIRERVDKITAGKWKYYSDWQDEPECFVEAVEQSGTYPFAVADLDFGNTVSQKTPAQVNIDGKFIAHAPEDIRRLLDLVDTQATQLREGREIVGEELVAHREELADWILYDDPPDGDEFSTWIKERIEKLDAWLKDVADGHY